MDLKYSKVNFIAFPKICFVYTEAYKLIQTTLCLNMYICIAIKEEAYFVEEKSIKKKARRSKGFHPCLDREGDK